MRIYVVKITRLRDVYIQYPVGALKMELAEESAKDIVLEFGKRCNELLKQKGSRCWINSFVQVDIESRKAPFKVQWSREEWTFAKLS